MHIDLMRDQARHFPVVANPAEVSSMRIWNCKYVSLRAIADFQNIEELIIAALPDKTIDFITPLARLRYLRIIHLPKISEISSIERLCNLESLSLATSPTWDSSGKLSIIESLDPVARLPALKHLELFGICPLDKSLMPLEKCQSLQSARFSKYPAQEVERFFALTKVMNQFNPEPRFLSEPHAPDGSPYGPRSES